MHASSQKSSDRSSRGRERTDAEFTVPYLGEFLDRPEKLELVDLDENDLLQIPLPAEHESLVPAYGNLPRDNQSARHELAWKERGSYENSIRARMQAVPVAREPQLNVLLNSSDVFSSRRTSTGRPVSQAASPEGSPRQHEHHHHHLLHWDRGRIHFLKKKS
uniref:Uncharacterized protein n=1 Tax=Rhodosorus marinus TaxID=101924 RepID=A0A7S0G3N4_9RHOD|mmetsp:Transcript_20496/g.29742  ORF Transcript_20496/g.29742 Transcript_20496/m.29742 type:complete len:162 (+) Transcript_20496:204-689(+)